MTTAAAATAQRPRRRDRVWIAAVLAALAAVLAGTQATWRLDRVIYDQALAAWSRPPPPDITIVAIDDASVAAIGRWPWPRAVHATLLERLAAAGPKAVLLDLVLSEAEADPRQDVLLAAAMQRAAPVVLPLPYVSVNGAAPQWLAPAPALAGAAVLAAAEAAVDADGVLRHAFLHVGEPGALRPHVALALLQAAGEALHPAARALASEPGPVTATAPVQAPDAPAAGWQRDGRLLIRYGGPPGHVDRVSYLDVLRGAVPAERLRGRYLLVGMTALGLGDTLATPVNAGHRAMPGVEVLAQTLHMLRSGDVLATPTPGVLAAGWALLVATGVLLMARLGQRTALLVALGAAAAVLAGAVLAVGGGWWLPPSPALAAALLAYPLWSWRRLERAVTGLDNEIRQLGAEAAGLPGRDPIEDRLQRLHSAATLLREARRYLADMLESLPTAMLVADQHQRVVMANAQAAALFEVGEADELAGLDLPRLLQEFRTAEPPDWARLLAGLQPGGEQPALQVRLAEHGDYVVQLSAAELAGSRRLLVSIADVAPVKRAERQREEALAFVSHDLRSPASAILLLTDTVAADAGAQWLPQVRQLAQRSLELSEAFVRYAQAELVAPQLESVDLMALLQDCAAGLAPQAGARGVRLQCTLEAGAAEAVLDRALVSRALGNLVSNALRHGPAGGQVRLQARADGEATVFSVSDDGPGLDAAQQQALAQADDGLRSGHAQGVGLGLRFVQRVARRHGGMLRWRPASGATPACFELHLVAGGRAGAGGQSGNP